MNILVIGNGFDLAHGLPTRYVDFLEFTFRIKHILDYKEIDVYKKDHLGIYDNHVPLQDFVKKYIEITYTEKDQPSEIISELLKLVKNNFWLEYFEDVKSKLDGDWIDFENEISNVVQYLEKAKKLSSYSSIDHNRNIFKFIKTTHKDEITDQQDDISITKTKQILLTDLNNLIRCLEIYVTDCLEKHCINVVSPDIKDIKFDKIISFNYTDFFRKIYKPNNNWINYNFIHGKADLTNTVNTNNMVLGIDEYLPYNEINNNTKFIEFKKYFQRIHKKTGSVYKEWLDNINEENLKKSEKHEVYFFGHSLAITDKDVIREIINNENIKTTIFYYNEEIYGQQIANLVEVIEYKTLIKKVYGASKSIVFKKQKGMIALSDSELEIQYDIDNLYQLHRLSNKLAHELMNKIDKMIIDEDTDYFKTQKNVISIYDALVNLEKTDDEEKLLLISEKIYKSKSEFQLATFNYSDWNDSDNFGEYDPKIETIKFIKKVNQFNKDYLKDNLSKYALNIINGKNLIKINDLIKQYPTTSIKSLTKIFDTLLDMFNNSHDEPIFIWEAINNLISKNSPENIKEFIVSARKSAKENNDYILSNKIKKIENELEEWEHNRRQMEAYERDSEFDRLDL